MKSYIEAKSLKELTEVLGLPKSEAAKIAMRTSLVVAIRRLVEKKAGPMPKPRNAREWVGQLLQRS